MPRPLVFVLSLWLLLASAAAAFADDDQPVPPPEPEAPVGPNLAVQSDAPVACDPSVTSQHFLEVRGAGFDGWSLQRLNGSLLDASGAPQVNWASVWVSPQGKLTLEIGLCNDPFQARPALAPGTYTVSIGSAADGVIASTGLELLAAPPEASTGDSVPASPADGSPTAPPDAAQSAPPAPPVVTPPATTVSAPPTTPARAAPPTPRSGPGSRQQPFPLGAAGQLDDGWQIVVSGVTPNAFDGIHTALPSAHPPAADQRDVMLRIEATYRGDNSGIFTAGRMILISASGQLYDQIQNNCGIVPDALASSVLTAGGVARGNVCFTVRASDVDSLLLADGQSTEAQRPYFSLR